MPLDENDLKKVQEMIGAALTGDILKSAIGEILKAHSAEQDKRFEARLKKEAEERQKALDEAVKGLKPADPSPADASKGQGERSAGSKGEGGQDPELLKLKEQLQKLEQQAKQAEEARKQAEEARRQERLLNEFRAAAQKAGIPADRIKAAEALLYHAEKRLRYGGSDEAPGIHFARKGYEEVLPLEEGLKEWLASEDGKVFLPPRDVAGTGQGAGVQRPPVASGGKVDLQRLQSRALGAVFELNRTTPASG